MAKDQNSRVIYMWTGATFYWKKVTWKSTSFIHFIPFPTDPIVAEQLKKERSRIASAKYRARIRSQPGGAEKQIAYQRAAATKRKDKIKSEPGGVEKLRDIFWTYVFKKKRWTHHRPSTMNIWNVCVCAPVECAWAWYQDLQFQNLNGCLSTSHFSRCELRDNENSNITHTAHCTQPATPQTSIPNSKCRFVEELLV
jgi:hypothetical protein